MPNFFAVAAVLCLPVLTVSGLGQTEASSGGATMVSAATVPAVESLPDAPGVSTSAEVQQPGGAAGPSGQGGDDGKQTSRILGIIPNFRSVSAGAVLPPQTVKDKFKTGMSDSFDYSAFLFVGIQAGIAQVTKSYPAFHQGAPGYARYYWHTFADQADENLLVESVIPAALREDSRYYTLGHGGFVKRSGYALSRALITRTDSGGETANVAEVLGAGSAAAISAAYYPGQYRTWTKVGQRWLTNVILDTGELYVKEFWPDINSALTHKKGD